MQKLSLDEQKQLEIEILEQIDDFCRRHEIRYYLSFGTLLGAIRHKGFIPWDDDIDIMMPRSDYERFYEAFLEQDKFPALKLTSYRDKSSIYPFFKIVDTRTLVVERYIDPKYTTGVWIDIFPIDGAPRDKSIFELNRKTKRIYTMATANPKEGSSPLARVVKQLTHPFYAGIDIFEKARMLDEACASIPIVEGEDISLIIWDEGDDVCLPYSVLDDAELEFEGRQFCAPKDYDTFLQAYYGDYMQLPPENERVPHYCDAFWINEP